VSSRPSTSRARPQLSATIEVLLIALDSKRRSRGLIAELHALHKRHVIRVIDAVLVERGADDSIRARAHSELTTREVEHIRSVMTEFLGYEPFEGDSPPPVVMEGSPALLSAEDMRRIALMLRPNEAALAVVIEHEWAARLGKLIRSTGVTAVEDYTVNPQALGGLSSAISIW
jgi:hypothetical protein